MYEKSRVRCHEVHVYRLLHQWGFVPKVATKRFVNSATCKEKLLFKEKNKKYVGTKMRQGFIIIEQDESIFIADAIVQKKMDGQKGDKVNSHH